jgi:hypothetical protein
MPVALTGYVPEGRETAAMSAATVIVFVIAITLSILKRER